MNPPVWLHTRYFVDFGVSVAYLLLIGGHSSLTLSDPPAGALQMERKRHDETSATTLKDPEE